jgi:MFS family permease
MTSIPPLEETKLTRRLALGVMSIGFGQSAFIVLVPLVMARLGLTTLDLGLAVAAGTLAFLVGAPLWGSASSRIGHGSMIRLLGLAMLAAQALLVVQLSAGPTAYAIALVGLILSRLIYGFAAAGVMPAAQAWLAGTVEAGRRQAAFGFFECRSQLRPACGFGGWRGRRDRCTAHRGAVHAGATDAVADAQGHGEGRGPLQRSAPPGSRHSTSGSCPSC